MDERLQKDVRRAFAGDADEVMRLLSQYGSDPSQREVDRVQRAILSLSGSDIERVRGFVAVAETDYRDVLMWAEHSAEPDEAKTYEELRSRLGLPPED